MTVRSLCTEWCVITLYVQNLSPCFVWHLVISSLLRNVLKARQVDKLLAWKECLIFGLGWMLLGVFASWFWNASLEVSVFNQLSFQCLLCNNFTVLVKKKYNSQKLKMFYSALWSKRSSWFMVSQNWIIYWSSLKFNISSESWRVQDSKVPSGRHGQVDSPSGQVTFHSRLLVGQEIKQVVC